ncbi:MAG: creatininase family protein [Nitrososphaerales archaeon]
MSQKDVYLADMTWPEIKDVLTDELLLVIPTATTEQHGPHMPLNTDCLRTIKSLEKAAEKVGGVLITPVIPFGLSQEHMVKPGTLNLRVDTLTALIRDIVTSLVTHGVKRFLIWNSHFGNMASLGQILPALRAELNGKVIIDGIFPERLPSVASLLEQIMETPRSGDRHAAEMETSALLALYPETVRKEKITYEPPQPLGERGLPDLSNTSGVVGDSTKGSASKGEQAAAEIEKAAIDLFHRLKTCPIAQDFKPTFF